MKMANHIIVITRKRIAMAAAMIRLTNNGDTVKEKQEKSEQKEV